MPDATFACADLTTFCRLDGLGLEVTSQRLRPDRAVLACRIADDDSWCRRCGEQGAVRDTVTRQLAHEPFGWRPTTLLVTVRRYRSAGCAHVWRQDISKAAEPRAKLSRRALQWALQALVCQHLSVARVAEGLAVSWNTANNAVLAEGRRVLIADPARFDGVAVIGVDEHVWRHTRRGDKYVTVIIDLTPVRDKTGPARLLDMVEGRSKKAFQDWLAQRPQDWRDRVEVVAMDGFSGFKTASTEELPDAIAVMDPFHVVRLAGNALDECRRRVQLATCGHRGHKTGRTMMAALITTLSAGVPKPLQELITLGRTLKMRAVDVLAYFDRPGTSNGPTEAINGRLEHLRGSALGFRNLTNYIARSLLETGGFRPRLHPQS
ncbi:MAG: ISL3 family transposase [Actinomycetia bacterium]|nr:ISL3 family transposase [Actinomycetes bacterium]